MQSLMQGMTKGERCLWIIKCFPNRLSAHRSGLRNAILPGRSHVLKYDDVMNKQREVIYSQRRKVLLGEDISDTIIGMRHTLLEGLVDAQCAQGSEGFEPRHLLSRP